MDKKLYLASLESIQEIREAFSDIEIEAAGTDELVSTMGDGVQQLEQLGKLDEAIDVDEAIPESAKHLAEVALESMRKKLGVVKGKPALEGGVKETLMMIWQKLVEFVEQIWERLQLLIKQLMFGKTRLKRAYKNLKDQVEHVQGHQNQNWSDNATLAKFFSIDRKADAATVRTLLDRVNQVLHGNIAAMEYINAEISEVSVVKDDVSAKFDPILQDKFFSNMRPLNHYRGEDSVETTVYGPFPGAKVMVVGSKPNPIARGTFLMSIKVDEYPEIASQIELAGSKSEISAILDRANPDKFDYDENLVIIDKINRHLQTAFSHIQTTSKVANQFRSMSGGNNAKMQHDLIILTNQLYRIIKIAIGLAQRIPIIHYSAMQKTYEYCQLSINSFEKKHTGRKGETVDNTHGRPALTHGV